MDLSWNYAAEAQAYDRYVSPASMRRLAVAISELRCHRIGQEKEVHVKRLVVEDTIEDRYGHLFLTYS